MIFKYEHDILCSKIENFQFFFLKKNYSEISKIVKEMIRILELEGV